MRKLIVLAGAMVLVGMTTASPAVADEYDDLQSHPLRLAAYLLHPIGFATEWLVTRPFHELVSQPDLAPVFGHHRHDSYGGSEVNTQEARLLGVDE